MRMPTYKLLRVLLLLLLPAALAAAAESSATNRVVIASWNVENLFDPEGDPDNPGSVDFTPAGWTRWTPWRYERKLEHLAEVIAAMRPDILCLLEIENRRVVEDLVRTLREKQQFDLPVIVHREGGDRRGIDVAILAHLAPVATNWVAPVPEQRDILVARFVVGGRPLTICLNHWKSWVGTREESTRIRMLEAQAARVEVSRPLQADPAAAVLALGDFNDNVDAASLTQAAGFALWTPEGVASNREAVLFNLAGMLPPAARGTYYYGKDRVWNSFDSISVSRGLLPGGAITSAWQVATNTYAPFALPQQRDADGHPLPFHRVRKKDADGVIRSNYLTGYSDHFPVRVELEAW